MAGKKAAHRCSNVKEMAVARLEQLRSALSTGRNDLKQVGRCVDDRIHERPYVVIGLVAGAAAVAGVLLGAGIASSLTKRNKG